MKKILITGKNSYIGNAFAKWISGKHDIDYISCRTEGWKSISFSDYDIILHVAGIAHVSADPNMESLYYKVNRDLTTALARKAKSEGVKQFIFISSIIVYGDSSFINKESVITTDTIPQPENFYGKSKLQAEQGILALQSDEFNVVALRPPMIYGKGSKGNYPKLANIVKKLPIFPDVDNERSMLYIDNLCEFIRLMVENEEHGVFFPQNAEFVKTSTMAALIAEANGRKLRLTKLFNPLLSSLGSKIGIVNKAFGNLVYEKSISYYKENYRIRNFRESIRETEKYSSQDDEEEKK